MGGAAGKARRDGALDQSVMGFDHMWGEFDQLGRSSTEVGCIWGGCGESVSIGFRAWALLIARLDSEKFKAGSTSIVLGSAEFGSCSAECGVGPGKSGSSLVYSERQAATHAAAEAAVATRAPPP